MKRYCTSKAVLAERMIDVGLDNDARHLLFLLQKCAALSDCDQWRQCAQIADRLQTKSAGHSIH